MDILVTWIGDNDLNIILTKNKEKGPVIALLKSEYSEVFDKIHILYNNHRPVDSLKYREMLASIDKNRIVFHYIEIDDPSDMTLLYRKVTEVLEDIKNKINENIKWHFHMSPGTSQMASIWVLLGKTNYPAKIYQSHYDKEEKTEFVKIMEIPFRIEMEYIEDQVRRQISEDIIRSYDTYPEFSNIIHQSENMKKILEDTKKIALYDIPVLILGETGTGKELLAQVIHKISKRKNYPLRVLNCSALQDTIAKAELFGCTKEAFTGAVEKKGLFRECDKGSIFLDEIGDLSIELQTALLRLIENGEVQRLGDLNTFKVDVRIITATNRDLTKMIEQGKFRDDLYHRINIGFLKLPPLRDRGKDTLLIAEHYLEIFNDMLIKKDHIYPKKHKTFSDNTKFFIQNYHWSGNIRELSNVIKRAFILKENAVIEEEDIKRAFLDYHKKKTEDIEINFINYVNLENKVDDLRKSYIIKALGKTGFNYSKAAKLLGYNNYQTLKNHAEKLNIQKI